MSKPRFYIDTQGNDDEAYRLAMLAACELAEKDDEIKKVILLIGSKQSTGWFERLFDDATVKALHGGKRFAKCKPLFKFETIRTYKDSYTPSDVVISCGLNADEVFKVDDYYCVKAIIAIPWLRENLQKWVQTWSPLELRGKQEAVNSHPEPSCIVKQAMQDLTSAINMTTGIVHPMDEKLAKTYIRALHKYEPSLNTDVVGAYLVKQLGWDTRHAQAVEKLINTLNEGRHFRGGDTTGLQHYYKQWKEECAGKS